MYTEDFIFHDWNVFSGYRHKIQRYLETDLFGKSVNTRHNYCRSGGAVQRAQRHDDDLCVAKTESHTQQTACCWHTVSVAAALLSFLLSLLMTSEPHASYFCWVASGWKWLHVWFAWNRRREGAVGGGLYHSVLGKFTALKQDALTVLETFVVGLGLMHRRQDCASAAPPLLLPCLKIPHGSQCLRSANPSGFTSLLYLNLLHLFSAPLFSLPHPAASHLSHYNTEFTLRLQFQKSIPFFPPPLSFFLGWERWSQVGLQTWVMWLRLTHTARHQPSVWSQQWHKRKNKHTHTLHTESTHRQTDLAVPTIWNPVMQVAIIITLYYVIIIEKLKMNPSGMTSDC